MPRKVVTFSDPNKIPTLVFRVPKGVNRVVFNISFDTEKDDPRPWLSSMEFEILSKAVQQLSDDTPVWDIKRMSTYNDFRKKMSEEIFHSVNDAVIRAGYPLYRPIGAVRKLIQDEGLVGLKRIHLVGEVRSAIIYALFTGIRIDR